MYPDSPFAKSIGSFNYGKSPPSVDPNGGELHYVGLNCEWFPYIIGALKQLLLQQTWDVTDSQELNLVQMRVFTLLSLFDCARTPTLKDICPSPGLTQEDFMPIRVDCNCNVFVTCCDGTEKQILTADQVRAIAGGQPGNGSPQPQPGGGCQQYHALLPGNGLWLAPTVVSTGDTVQISGESGVAYDGHQGLWHCPDGSTFFAGACTGITATDPSAPMPTVPIAKIIARINGVYYDVGTSVFTVPSGISSQQIEFLLNSVNIPANSGQYQFDVTVCNNQLGTFTHTFNFVTNPGGWSVRDEGSYSAGVGFVDGTVFYSPNIFRGTDIQRLAFPARTITRVQWTSNYTPGSGSNVFGLSDTTPGTYYYTGTPVTGSNQYDTGPVNRPGITNLYIDMICGDLAGVDPGGSAIISQVIVEGIGSDPF